MDEEHKPCVCGGAAIRVPFYSVAVIDGNSRAAIPSNENEYHIEDEKRKLKGRGWDGDRAVEYVRTQRKKTPDGATVNL